MTRLVLRLSAVLVPLLSVACAQQTVSVRVPTALIFDPVPGVFSPEDYADRAPWPSTPSYVSQGERIDYRERFYDRQGDHLRHDHFIRRFVHVRRGRGYR